MAWSGIFATFRRSFLSPNNLACFYVRALKPTPGRLNPFRQILARRAHAGDTQTGFPLSRGAWKSAPAHDMSPMLVDILFIRVITEYFPCDHCPEPEESAVPFAEGALREASHGQSGMRRPARLPMQANPGRLREPALRHYERTQ